VQIVGEQGRDHTKKAKGGVGGLAICRFGRRVIWVIVEVDVELEVRL
jgi:hypothetical protein